MKHKNYRWHLNLQLFAGEPDAANGSTADPDANPESRGEEQPDPEKSTRTRMLMQLSARSLQSGRSSRKRL